MVYGLGSRKRACKPLVIAGLKYVLSPLAQGRGLKLKMNELLKDISTVAPRAGAWIETCYSVIQVEAL